jgi:hypothetical protein
MPADRPSPSPARSSVHISDGAGAPVHRWFPYAAGFSGTWAGEVLDRSAAEGRLNVFDPFCGTGTTLVEAQRAGLPSLGTDANPVAAQIALAKLSWRTDYRRVGESADVTIDLARRLPPPDLGTGPLPSPLAGFSGTHLRQLLGLLHAIHAAAGRDDLGSRLLWLSVMSILEPMTTGGGEPFDLFAMRVREIASDVRALEEGDDGSVTAMAWAADARVEGYVPERWADMVLTEPPVLGAPDSASALSLVSAMRWPPADRGHEAEARARLMPSSEMAARHVSDAQVHEALGEPGLATVSRSLATLCTRIAREARDVGHSTATYRLPAVYFRDLARVAEGIRAACRPDAQVCMLLRDATLEGVPVAVGDLAVEVFRAAGFVDVALVDPTFCTWKHVDYACDPEQRVLLARWQPALA